MPSYYNTHFKTQAYSSVIPTVSIIVLHECEISLTAREEHTLRGFAARVPKWILGSERDEVTGSFIALHWLKTRTRWVYHLACMGQIISAHKILVGQLELLRQTNI